MTKPFVEEMIKIFDRGLRTLTGVESEHPMPEYGMLGNHQEMDQQEAPRLQYRQETLNALSM